MDFPHSQEKTYLESYEVNANAVVQLSNEFGEINITTWDKPEVVIKAVVKVEGDAEGIVQKQLNNISVNLEGNASGVLAETIISSWSKNDNWYGNKKANYDVEINYVVKMPKSCSLKARNRFGDLKLDDLYGEAYIEVSYGHVEVGALHNNDNELHINYSQGGNIDYVQSAKLELAYSDLEIGVSNALEVVSKYSDLEIDSLDSMEYYGRYDKLNVDAIADLSVDGKYSTIKIEHVGKTLDADLVHAKLVVDRVKKDFDQVMVENSYGPVVIEFDPGAQYAFNAKCKYSGVSCPDNATITSKEKDSSSSTYVGYVGGDDAEASVKVDSRYGSVKLRVIEWTEWFQVMKPHAKGVGLLSLRKK